MDRRAVLAAFAVLALGAIGARAGDEVVLLYVKQQGCPYCARFDRLVAPIYPNAAEARRAPMRVVERGDATLSMLELAGPVVFTPTFILLVGDREIGRIVGFSSEDFFWGQLQRLLARLPAGG